MILRKYDRVDKVDIINNLYKALLTLGFQRKLLVDFVDSVDYPL